MFQKAQRKKAKLKLAVTGPAGSGKTMSSLLIARGLVGDEGKIAVIDTELGSSELYSHLMGFDVAKIEKPYAIKDYITAIEYTVGKYDCLVIDSLTHAWKYILAEKEKMDQRGGNSFTNWGKLTPVHQKLIDAVLESDIHLIATMRSKMEYVMAKDSNGRNKIDKMGLAPVQRDDTVYEFSIVFDIARSHYCETTKDRTGLFDEGNFKPTVETGKTIRKWLEEGGEPIKEVVDAIPEYKPAEKPVQKVNKVEKVEEYKDFSSKRFKEIELKIEQAPVSKVKNMKERLKVVLDKKEINETEYRFLLNAVDIKERSNG